MTDLPSLIARARKEKPCSLDSFAHELRSKNLPIPSASE